MDWIVCLIALAQGSQEPRISDLDHESPEIREAAAKEIAARGPSLAATLLDHYRSSKSADVRGRIEGILLGYPFAAYLLTRAGEPLREKLESRILEPLSEHRALPGCWKAKEGRVALDPGRLHLVWQEGSGHGQMLRLTWIDSDPAGGLRLRRLTYQGKTPYRPKVSAEGVTVDEARLGPAEAAALASLLDQATALHPEGCAIPREPGKYSFSSASFSVRLQIESGGAEIWSSGYTGYPGNSAKSRYLHSRALEKIVDEVVKSTTWKPTELGRQDRANASQWILPRFETEEWWIREHFLHTAKFAGDDSLLPLLRKVASGEPADSDPSGKRQVEVAREALSLLEPAKK